MESRIIVIGSNTLAIRARRALLSEGISARTVKLSKTSEGCRYGVEIPARDVDRALIVLYRNGIGYSGII